MQTSLTQIHLSALTDGKHRYKIRTLDAQLTGKTYLISENKRVKVSALMKPDSIFNEYMPVMFIWCKTEDTEEAKKILHETLLKKMTKHAEHFQKILATLGSEPNVRDISDDD